MSVINREHYFARLDKAKQDVLRGDPAMGIGLAKAQELLWDEPEISSAWTWISVEDRLPEDGQDVLVVCHRVQRGLPSPPFCALAKYGDSGFHSKAINMDLCEVTHWAPLPPLPGEVEGGGGR